MGRMVVPPAVIEELAVGRALGIRLPNPTTLDWVSIRQPQSQRCLTLITDLGPGEREALALALESTGATVVLDDGFARRVAKTLGISVIGVLGVLLNAKESGLIRAVKPHLARLQALGFRLAPGAREAVIRLAGEG